MKKVFVFIFVFVGLLLMSNFTPIGNTSKVTVSNKISSAGIMASDPIFPTNATFETKAEVIGNASVASIGGTGSDYYAQSFRALSDYIINGGLWIEHYSGVTPSFRLMLCDTTETGWPNVANPMALTTEISNETIYARPGRFYLNLTKPVRVLQNKTYWLVIDGYYDHTTVGSGRSRRRGDNPYPDGNFAYSNNNGTNWTPWSDSDLDFVVNFSNRPNKTEVFGMDSVYDVGGQYGSDYYAQSFKALDSYIIDAGIWIEEGSGATPDFRVQIWGNNASDYPDKNNVIASSRVIKGNEINSTQGQRWFVHPNVSIPVTVGETYWVVIDGYIDQNSTGYAGSRGDEVDIFKDGEFLYSNNVGSTWSTWSTKDLNFVVTFSAQRSTIKVDGDKIWQSIGGTGTVNYAGQSFKALNKYILDAGVWLENYTNNCPDIRLLLCAQTPGGDPNVTSPIVTSIPITGEQIMGSPGWHYLRPTKPVEVVAGQTYYLIIDGWYDNTTAASVKTYDRYDNPYKDGRECGSFNAGSSWTYYSSYDLSMDIRFSDVPYQAQCGENRDVHAVGGAYGSDYYAQSFVALNDYIADAGVWIENYSTPTPNFRILLCSNDVDHPNVTDVIAMSMVIRNTTIDANPGLYYIKPATPIPMEVGETYWVVIDGNYDNVTAGEARSRGVDFDAYPDGEFKYSNDDGETWYTFAARDLKFEVVFTHVNQPPTQPTVTISPSKPFDSDDLTALWPIPSTDLEEEPLSYSIEWYKDGVPQPAWANNIVVPNSATMPTEDWMVKVTPWDGHINGTAGFYIVHVQADIVTIDHPVTADSQPFHVFTKSNTTITDFDFSYTTQGAPAFIAFTTTGPAGAKGFCNVTIPKNLMYGSWVFIINGTLTPPTPPQVIITENDTHAFIFLSYSTSSVPIIIQATYIVPEFTATTLILTIAIITLALAIVKKKITKRKH